MALESATYLDGLNTSNPDGDADSKSQGDDHLRLLKGVLKNTFPGVAFPIGIAAITGADTKTASLSPAPSAYVNGMIVWGRNATVNTGTATLNLNTLGAKDIKKNGGVELLAGDMPTGYHMLVYNSTEDYFELLNHALPISAAGKTLIEQTTQALMISTGLGLDADLATFALPASTTISTFGRTLVDDAAAVNGRNTLELGTSDDVRFDSFGVGTAASGTSGEIRATNDVTAFYSSDRRLKENIKPLTDAMEKILRIQGVEFDWSDDYVVARGGEDDYFVRRHDVGVIAQEIREVLPEVVAERKDGYLAVKYDRIVALLIQGIHELDARVKELEAK